MRISLRKQLMILRSATTLVENTGDWYDCASRLAATDLSKIRVVSPPEGQTN